MSKYPSEPEKSCVDDEDYEIVSFEDFCDKSPGSKTDLLTLNDNINYRLCFERDKTSEYVQGEPSAERHSETSLDGSTIKNKLSGPFAPFGRSNVKTGRGSLFGGVIPKPRNDGESSREHRYQRFSGDRTIFQRIWDNLPGFGSGMLGVALVCGLCVAAWWAVGGAVGGAWGEEHYRKLWERAHPDNIKTPLSPIPFEKVPDGYRYHDHNNLSTKNKNISTELRKKEAYKKSYSDLTPEMQTEVCGLVEENMRFDCFPSKEASEEGCVKRGCCWKASSAPNTAPYCYYPPHYNPYNFVNMTENKHGMTVYYTLARPSGYPDDFALLKMDVKYLSDDVLQIKISDAEHKRFEVPVPQIPMVPGPITNMKFRVQVDSASVGFKVIRNADNVTIVNTQDVGAMILSNKFLQISTILPTNNVFGFGEHRDRFKRDMNWKTYTMFNRDVPPTDNTNLYGTHPFYMAVESEGNSHGMLLLNSNAMDVVFQPTPALTLRTLGGVLNLFIMLGPSPREVISQYTGLIGRPFMPPYWSLGFHLCKFGYGDLNTTRKVWQTNREAGIPFDVIWNDIDYMNNFNDFTYDPVKYVGLPDFIRKVHMKGMRYVILIDPGISAAEKPGTYPPYERGIQYDIFVKNGTNQPFIGKVWNPVSTVYPDFTHPNSTAYWLEQMDAYHNKVPYDGAWIDMNEPSNFLDGPIYGYCEPEDLPYKPAFITSVGLRHKTLCTDAKHYIGAHYDVHNLYGLTEAIATNFALMEIRGRRPFIISRSSFPGLGHYAGHWSGDIFSTWDDMRMTISDLLSFSLFGVPMMGSDICGFNGNTTVELCKRWMQLGAFYPFSRNHNDIAAIPQDPVSLGPIVVDASIDALRLRYRLLPYYYTLFWRAHVYGETVARPMFFEFPTDLTVRSIDYQFLIGPHVMIAPILTEGTNTTRAYFPGPHKWFNLRDGTFISYENWFNVNEFQTVSIRGGGIIPLQDPPFRGPVTTSNTRSGPFQLLVAPDITDNGRGELYWDDGESLNSYEERKYSHIEFTLKKGELQSNVIWWGYGVPLMNNITIIGQSYPVGSVYLNGDLCQKPHCEYNFVGKTKTLYIYGINLSLDKPFNVKWSTDYPPEVKHSTKKVLSNFGFGVG